MNEAMRRALRWPLQDEASDKGGDGGGGGKGGDKGADKGGEKNDLGTVEDRARRMGWVPQEEFRGDKAKWTDAATFVKNGEESLPILRERLRTLERTNVDLSKSVTEFKKMSDENFNKGYERAKRELESKIEAAAEKGGEEGKKEAKAATAELSDLERQKAQRDAQQAEDPVFKAWTEENSSWYQDPELRAEAEVEAFRLRRAGEKSEGAPFLDKVKENLKKRFPAKFGNPRRDAAGAVERSNSGGDGGGDGGGGGKKGWDKLPAEAKEAGERYIKQKLYKDKAAYAEAFWAQN